ncbi:MAG: hypothetical protein IJ168_07290 [Eubacterium sp.]|nr:hypothetical protein [Eubacterium sp.]
MTNKELLYIEDALGHEAYFQTRCEEIEQQLSDTKLKNSVCDMKNRHRQIFDGFLNLLDN